MEKYQKIFLLVLLMSFAVSGSASVPSSPWDKKISPEGMLRKFVEKRDTTDLYYTLQYLNLHFTDYKKQSVFSLLEEAARQCEKSELKYLPHFYYLIRLFYRESGNKPKSLEYALKTYHLLNRTGKTERLLWTMIDIGNIFYSEKDYDQAETFYKKAEMLAKSTNETYALSVIYLNFGMVSDQKLEFEQALHNYDLSCRYRIDAGNVKFLASTYIKMANTLLHLKRHESALEYIHLTEEYYYHRGKPNVQLDETPTFIALTYADYYAETGVFKKASVFLLKARKLAFKAGFQIHYFNTFFVEANYLIRQEKYAEAIRCIQFILPGLKEKHQLEDLKYAYRILSRCFARTNDLTSAEAAFDSYATLNDSLNHSSTQSQLNTMRTLTAVFESNSKLQDAKRNLEISDMNNILQSRQRGVFYWIFGIATFAILILLVLFFNLRKNKKRLQQLHFKSLLQNNEIKIKSSELQRSDQIKDKLFSIIAHDLRNPLNRLLVELAIVKKTIGSSEITEPMENTLKETIGLFERLLQWSKMDNKQNIYSPVKINLNENINKIITFYLPEMQLREISIINNSETLLAFVDPNILQTLLRNFLSNAISVVSRGGTIEIEASVTSEENIEVVFSDSGPGFPQEILDNFHIERNDLNSASNGLGLTLCKVLAKMSGWPLRISNDSKYSGARVSIILPIFKEKRRSTELSIISRAFQPSDFWKERLMPIQEYKFYQTSQIRFFLKSLGSIEDPQVRLWARQVEQAVHQGDKDTFSALMNLITD